MASQVGPPANVSQPSLLRLLRGSGSAISLPHAAAVPLRLPAPKWLSALGFRLEVALAASQAESCLLPAAVVRRPGCGSGGGSGGGARVYGPARAARSVTLPLWQLHAGPHQILVVGDPRCLYRVRCAGEVGTWGGAAYSCPTPGLWGPFMHHEGDYGQNLPRSCAASRADRAVTDARFYGSFQYEHVFYEVL